MFWNEKINLLQRNYTSDEFFVPNVDRKQILRKIESHFIKRTEEYYHSNDFTGRFSNWWQYLNCNEEWSIESFSSLDTLFTDNRFYWIAGELGTGVMIYKAKKSALLDLINIGRTWTRTFHVIDLKYDSMIGIRFKDDQIELKLLAIKVNHEPRLRQNRNQLFHPKANRSQNSGTTTQRTIRSNKSPQHRCWHGIIRARKHGFNCSGTFSGND